MRIHNRKTDPAARQRKIEPVRGIAILAICLSAAFVQAANAAGAATTAAPDGSLPDSIVPMANLNNANTTIPGTGCGEHIIACYDDSRRLLGEIDTAPCYRKSSACEDDKATDFHQCKLQYPDTAIMQRVTTCIY